MFTKLRSAVYFLIFFGIAVDCFVVPLRSGVRRSNGLQMKIDYGVGYDPRNRPRLAESQESMFENKKNVDVAPIFEQETFAPSRSESWKSSGSLLSVEDDEVKQKQTSVLHNAVIVLKVCLGETVYPEKETKTKIEYYASGYDPKNRV